MAVGICNKSKLPSTAFSREPFKRAYSDISVPDNYKDELKNQKTAKYYTSLLNSNPSHLNKTGIASILMDMIKNPPSDIEASLCNTMKKYEELVRIIEKKQETPIHHLR